jgi:hypothetical protein
MAAAASSSSSSVDRHRPEKTGNDARPRAPDQRAGTVAQRGAVRSQDPVGKTVPVALGGWEKEMPNAGGAKGSGGPKGARNGHYEHGRYTAEMIATRRWLRETTREVRALTRTLRDQR